jgi:hypothetical protein
LRDIRLLGIAWQTTALNLDRFRKDAFEIEQCDSSLLTNIDLRTIQKEPGAKQPKRKRSTIFGNLDERDFKAWISIFCSRQFSAILQPT